MDESREDELFNSALIEARDVEEDIMLEKKRAYKDSIKEQKRKYSKKYRDNNKEKIRERERLYSKKSRDKKRVEKLEVIEESKSEPVEQSSIMLF